MSGVGRREFLMASGALTSPGAVAAQPTGQKQASSTLWKSPREFGARGDGITDDRKAFRDCYSECEATGAAMAIPAGDYRVDGLVWSGGVQVRGNGPGRTRLRACDADATIVTLNDRKLLHSDGNVRGYTVEFGSFLLDGTGSSNVVGLRCDANIATRVTGVSIQGCNIGIWAEGVQYSVFDQVTIQRCRVGLLHRDAGDIGGGLNNEYRSLTCYLNEVGILLGRTGAKYPAGLTRFTNLKAQQNSLCALYAAGQMGTYISEFGPEENGHGSIASAMIEGQEVRRAAIHAVDSVLLFENYDHAQAGLPIYAEAGSALSFRGVTGAAIVAHADDTSTIEMDGHFGNGSRIHNGFVTLRNYTRYATILNTSVAFSRLDPFFPNDTPQPLTPITRGFAGTTARAGAADGIAFTEITLSGGKASRALITTADSAYQSGKDIFLAFLIYSEQPCELDLNLAQSSVSGKIDLPARKWMRVFMKGYNNRGAVASNSLSLAGPSGTKLRVTRMISASSLSASEVRLLCTDHPCNPRA